MILRIYLYRHWDHDGSCESDFSRRATSECKLLLAPLGTPTTQRLNGSLLDGVFSAIKKPSRPSVLCGVPASCNDNARQLTG